MKTTLLILTLAGICAASTVTGTSAPPCSSASSILGAEDWVTPASDLDFNDLTYWVCGLSYGYGPEFSFIPPSGYSEQPFPQPAWYADFGIALDNEVSFAFRSSQTSGHDSAWISQNAEPWQFVGPGITLETAPGDRIDFAILADGHPLFADPAKNADRLGYFVALFAGNRAHGAHRDARTCDVRASPCSDSVLVFLCDIGEGLASSLGRQASLVCRYYAPGRRASRCGVQSSRADRHGFKIRFCAQPYQSTATLRP